MHAGAAAPFAPAEERLVIAPLREVLMIQMSHIFVLSQAEFVERQVGVAIAEESATPVRWRVGSWLKKRLAPLA